MTAAVVLHDQCTGTAKSTGERCKRRPIPGGTVCVKHGGAAPQVQAKAARNLALLKATEEVRSLGLRADVSPAEALEEALQSRAADRRHLADRIAELGEEITQEDLGPGGYAKTVPHVLVELKRQADVDTAQIARAALAAGVEERKASLDEAQLRLHVQELLPRITGLLETLGHKLDDPTVIAALEAHFTD